MAPGRLARAMVTAGYSRPAGRSAVGARGPDREEDGVRGLAGPVDHAGHVGDVDGPAGAHADHHARHVLARSRNSGPASIRVSRLSRTAVPASWRAAAERSAPESASQLTPAAAMRSGSGSTRTTRGWPPIRYALLVSGISESSWASSAASGRSSSLEALGSRA